MTKPRVSRFALLALVLLAAGCRRDHDPNEPPVVEAVAPSFGPAAGGVEITVWGHDFDPGAAVTIGGQGVLTMNPTANHDIATAIVVGVDAGTGNDRWRLEKRTK